MKKLFLVLTLLGNVPTVATAQQQPDPAFLQRALAAMQTQRNQAQDIAAEREAQLMLELAKAQAKLKEQEAKPAPAEK
jgi:hypothetical protein